MILRQLRPVVAKYYLKYVQLRIEARDGRVTVYHVGVIERVDA